MAVFVLRTAEMRLPCLRITHGIIARMPREYPAYPIPSVGVVVVKNNKVLLVQRGNEPSRGRWTIPGGVIEVGETIHEAARRELREECSIEIEPGRVLALYEPIIRDSAGR